MYTAGQPATIEVNPGETTLVSKELVAGTGHLTIVDAPPGSIVAIDGKEVASSQALTTGIDVPAGSMDVTVQAPTSQKWSKDALSVGAGADVRQSVHALNMVLPRRTIQLDGNMDSWAGIEPVFDLSASQDVFMGERRYAVTKLYMCRDDKNLYWRVDFAQVNPLQKPPKGIKKQIICQLDVHFVEGKDLNLAESYRSQGGQAEAWTNIYDLFARRGTLQSQGEAFRNTENTAVVRIPLDRILKFVKSPVDFQLDVANFSDHGRDPSGFMSDRLRVDFSK